VRDPQIVGWVERSETHQGRSLREEGDGFRKELNPSYETSKKRLTRG
jgi:hypothetical protein